MTRTISTCFLIFAATVLLTATATATADDWTDRPIWPGTAPGEQGDIDDEKAVTGDDGITRLSNVTCPTVTVYRPEEGTANGTGLIVCPGGGYNILAWNHEGTQVAEYFQKKGVTVVLLKYRVPRRKDVPKHLPALQDAQRTVSLVRANAEELGIKPDQIGILGFSAGGHLTLMTSTHYNERAYEPIDDADKSSCRPDFAVPVYPAYLLEKDGQFLPEVADAIDKDTPPMCFIHGGDDPHSSLGSIAVYSKLHELKIDAELHIFARTGHGFGMKATDTPSANWPDRVADWLGTMGLLE